MRYVLFIFIILVFFTSCKKEEKEGILTLVEVKKDFDNQVEFKEISIEKGRGKAFVIDSLDRQKLNEYVYQSKKWKKNGSYRMEILGNVDRHDFLFSLEDSLIQSVDHALDSLERISEVKRYTLFKPEVYSEQIQLKLIIEYQEKSLPKKLDINY